MSANQEVVLAGWSLDVSNFEESALTVLKKVRPEWAADEIGFRYFTEGITNKLVGCYLKSAPEDVVLVRVNGEGTEHIIDRQQEVKTFHVLHAAQCCPPLYARFDNGMAYGFFPGQPLDEQIVRQQPVATLIAQEMVRLHSVSPDSTPVDKRESFYRNKTQNFLDQIPDSFKDPARQARYVERIPSRAQLQSELDGLVTKMEALRMPVVFSHNDLLLKNIIYNKQQNTVRFIDYEYAFLNYQAYDIGNHFCEYAGIDEVDYSLYPDKAYQLPWLRRYLEAWFTAQGKTTQDVSDKDVETLYVQTNVCACAAHFFWGLWALIQAKNSSIDFDFFEYSITRLDEYFACKKRFFDLQLP